MSKNLILKAILLFSVICLLSTSIQATNSRPELIFEPSLLEINLPEGMYLGEVASIAFNSKGNLFIFHRGSNQLIELDKNANFVRGICKNLFKVRHGLRIDEEDNTARRWAVRHAGAGDR